MKSPWQPYQPTPEPVFDRVVVLAFTDGQFTQVPVSDQTVVQIGAESFSMQGCRNMLVLEAGDDLLDTLRNGGEAL